MLGRYNGNGLSLREEAVVRNVKVSAVDSSSLHRTRKNKKPRMQLGEKYLETYYPGETPTEGHLSGRRTAPFLVQHK